MADSGFNDESLIDLLLTSANEVLSGISVEGLQGEHSRQQDEGYGSFQSPPEIQWEEHGELQRYEVSPPPDETPVGKVEWREHPDVHSLPIVSKVENVEDVGGDRCPVCEDGLAGRHTYYGGRACHSCRGFFRRSVQSGHQAIYVCPDEGRCVILSKSRRSCQACRFERCLRSGGLRTSAVMSAQQRRERMAKRAVRERQRRGSQSCGQLMTFGFPEEEKGALEARFSVLLDFNHRRHYRFLASDGGEMLDAFTQTVVKGRPFSKDLLRMVFTLDEQSTKGFSLDAVPEMSSLRSGSDRVALVAHNFGAIAGLEWAWFVTEGEDAKYLASFLAYGRRRRDSTQGELDDEEDACRVPVEGVISAVETANVTVRLLRSLHSLTHFSSWQATSKRWNMNYLYNLGAKQDEAQSLWRSLVRCLGTGNNAPENEIPEADPVLNILLAMVMLFDPDGGNPSKPLRLENRFFAAFFPINDACSFFT